MDRDTPRGRPTLAASLDGEEDQRIFPGVYSPVRHAHSLCCLCSLLVSSLADRIILHPHPVLHNSQGFFCGCLPTTLRARKLMGGPGCPFSTRTTNTASLANDIDHGDVRSACWDCRPSRPHRIVSSRIKHLSPRVFTSMRLLFRICIMVLAVARASLCPSLEHTRTRTHKTSCRSGFARMRM